MNDKLVSLLGDYKESYPTELVNKFPRIVDRIIELWYSKAIDDYFTELMIDDRGGTRQGFPPNIASEIFTLSTAHEKVLEQGQNKIHADSPWDMVEESKKFEIERLGYSFSPHGFIRSAEKGDTTAVMSFLVSGVDIDTRDERGWTPLMVSSFNGNEEVAILLIRHGADVHAKDSAGYGPLHWSALNGFSSVIKLLAERRADVNAQSKHGLTPLLQAATRGHLLAAGQLIARGANVDMPTNDGWTPLHKAAANGHTETVKFLLAKGAYRSPEYRDGTTPLQLAIKHKHKDIELLLSAK
ncbi:MAG: ankyrin repeat domain-containing protein [Gallionella sp.]